MVQSVFSIIPFKEEITFMNFIIFGSTVKSLCETSKSGN